MTIDFTKFGAAQATRPTRPRDIFASLPNRHPDISYLRDVQGQVLDQWYERRAERDLSIKMNTGTGKTIVGLLALQSGINESVLPALYVAPDKFLVEQVMRQARDLGTPCTSDPTSSAYRSGEAIGVVNVHRLVNGRSIFGGPGNSRDIPIGAVAIDDAHACLATIRENTSLNIPRDHEAYSSLLELFSDALEGQAPAAYAGLRDKVVGTLLRVPISAWSDHEQEIISLLQPHQDAEFMKFTWPFVAPVLPMCQAVFSERSLEIQPPCPPTNTIRSLEDSTRRLYLTATLADDTVLLTHFGAALEAAVSPITPESAADIGDRLILAPREIDPKCEDDEIREFVVGLSTIHNVVVLVPSYRAAEPWREHTSNIAGAEDLDSTTELLKDSQASLVVLVNKYDGIDLPDEACRILVLDGIPEGSGNCERREARLLGSAALATSRQLQKIEQGMGRGVRSAQDYCVVLFVGSGLSALLADPQMRKRLSPATHAQFELSMEVARTLRMNQLGDVIDQCLRRDEGWLTVSRGCLTGISYGEGTVEPFAENLREAFVSASAGRFDESTERIQLGIEKAENSLVKGWLGELLATYMQQTNADRAQHILASAIKNNSRILKPLKGVVHSRASSTIDQAKSARSALIQRFRDGAQLRLGMERLADDLTFDPQLSLDFEDAVEELGNILGFDVRRPERDTNKGPDVLWALGNLEFLVIECKSASISDVWKKDVGQLATSINWFRNEYDASCNVTPIMVHHSGKHAQDAIAATDTRVVDEACLAKLRKSLREFGGALTYESAFASESSVANQLNHFGFNRAAFVSRYTTRPS